MALKRYRAPGIACRFMPRLFRSSRSTRILIIFALTFTSTHVDEEI